MALLSAEDPAPVRWINPDGAGDFLLVCDHAGRTVPRALGDLGVPPAEWDRHIAWDIGAAGVCETLSPLLDAACIMQAYSRLVIDCNRPPGHPTSIVTVSDGTRVPANAGLDTIGAAARVNEIFLPYHAAISAELDRRLASGRRVAVIAIHSFTPMMGGVARPWHAGVLHDRTPELSLALAAELRSEGLNVGDNEPYRLTDESDYTIPVHAEARRMPYVELEIRQDLIAAPAGQAEWARRISRALQRAWESLGTTGRKAGAAGGD